MKNKKSRQAGANQSGFITMMLFFLVVLIVGVVIVYLRVMHAKK